MLLIYKQYPFLELEWAGYNKHYLHDSEEWYADRSIPTGGPVCELACGFGRLLLPIAKAGIQVMGCDAIQERINAAKEIFNFHGFENARFETCKLPDVPAGKFRAVILACNAIGYLENLEQKKMLLKNIYQILLPGGSLLLDHGRGGRILRLTRHWPGLSGLLQFERIPLKSSLRWDRSEECVVERFKIEKNGASLLCEDKFYFTSTRSTIAMIEEAGFDILEKCGSFSGTNFRPWSRRIAISAMRPGS